MRKTKIVCTIGPATDNDEIIKNLMLEGMNVARFNFSHGDYEIHRRRFEQIARIRKELNLPVATMLDTKGPEVRLGKYEKPVELVDGQEYTLTIRDVPCDEKIGSVSFKNLTKDVKKGNRLLINDGVIELVANQVTSTDIVCKVVHGGLVTSNKGINVPGVSLSMPFLSEADMNDLEFGAKMGFDFIAASFVQSSADINYMRKFLHSLGWETPRIIAKIENSEGVENINEILEVADGIMVARGDMGVEIPFEQIPAIQKEIISKAYNAGKQVITATQMLESMQKNPRPTRAEITDVANAIYDGTSAIMLSGETAAGDFPIEAVKTMALIARTTEQDINYKHRFSIRRPNEGDKNVTDAISHATVTIAHDLDVAAIVTVTKEGATSRMISKYRPLSPIFACTTSEIICRQMNLSWGVTPALINEEMNTDDLFLHAVEAAKACGIVKSGDQVVITAGVPLGISGNTNLLKVDTVK